MTTETPPRLVVGISGASGIPLAVRTVRALSDHFEVHAIVTEAAKTVIENETEDREATLQQIRSASSVVYHESDLGAPIASGSFGTDGMVVVPASMKSVAGIRTGLSENLLVRAADVTLKEDRPLVVVPRETPLSEIHLENLLELRRRGVAVVPPVLGFYFQPESMEDLLDHVVGKILERFDIEHDRYPEWDGFDRGE